MNHQPKITTKVALFPIPDMVTFPNTVVPLHVFEPRYRTMIKHCLDNQMMLAIANTKKIKGTKQSSTRKRIASVDELNKNQTSYEPHKVFSAGDFQVIDTTEDGRIHIQVNIKKRMQIVDTIQEIPFQITECIELVDQSDLNSVEQENDQMQEIYAVLLAISESQSPQLHEIISQAVWQDISPADFSFKVFQYFRFESEFMQHVLEQTSVSLRLNLIWQGINQSLQG